MTLKQLCSAIAATTVATSAFSAPLSIEKQGTFAVGGTVKTSAGTYNPRPAITQGKTSNNFMDVFNASIQSGGQTLHGDHATVHYQIPVNAKRLPLVFLHLLLLHQQLFLFLQMDLYCFGEQFLQQILYILYLLQIMHHLYL